MKRTPPVMVLLVLSQIKAVAGISVSNLSFEDVCSSGSSYSMYCTWTGTQAPGIVWFKGVDTIMTCDTSGVCISNSAGYATGSYPNSTTALLTITSFNPLTDAGAWSCRDGTDPPASRTLPIVATGSLNGTCTKRGNDHVLTCGGITDHGSPAVLIEIKEGNTVLASNTSGGSVSTDQSNAAGKTYNCSVSGDTSVCLNASFVPVKCEGPTTPQTTETVGETSSTEPTTNQTTQNNPDTPDKEIYIIIGCVVGGVVLIVCVVCVCLCIKRGWDPCGCKEKPIDVELEKHDEGKDARVTNGSGGQNDQRNGSTDKDNRPQLQDGVSPGDISKHNENGPQLQDGVSPGDISKNNEHIAPNTATNETANRLVTTSM